MNGLLDIIFFAVVAVFILMRLRNVLGQKTEDDDKRRMEKRQKYEQAKQAGPKVVNFPGKNATIKDITPDNAKVVSPNIAEGIDEKVMEVVSKVTASDRSFTLAWFMMGAKKAFEMIFEAFSKGDEKTLKNLLSDDVYKEFAEELNAQQEKNQKQDITLISVEDCSVVQASFEKNVASFTVKFISEQIRVTRDAESGEIIEGNASQIDQVEDVWTFTRNLRSSNPNWQVSDTQG